MTKIVNILAGSGCGKTTTAAGIFYEMKKNGINCEFVPEFVKKWAWESRPITSTDQGYILQKQYRAEKMLYGKVDYIITDSPFLLSPVYEKYYYDNEYTKDVVLFNLEKAKKDGIEHINILLNRTKVFNPSGRYETEKQAIEIDVAIKQFLCNNELEYYEVTKKEQDEKVAEILNKIGV